MATKDELKTLKMVQETLAGSFAIEGGVRGEGQEFDANYGDGVRVLPLSTSARGGLRFLLLTNITDRLLVMQTKGVEGLLNSQKSCGCTLWKAP